MMTSPHQLLPIVLLALVGCEPPEPEPPAALCDATPGEAARLDVSHYGTYGEPADIVYCGIPPQGGAPYAPFGIRVRGIDPDEAGLQVTMQAVDLDTGETVGTGEFTEHFICSNVGENEGHWVGSELHMRFYSYTIDDLHDRDVEIHLEAENTLGETVSVTFDARLDCVPGS